MRDVGQSGEHRRGAVSAGVEVDGRAGGAGAVVGVRVRGGDQSVGGELPDVGEQAGEQGGAADAQCIQVDGAERGACGQRPFALRVLRVAPRYYGAPPGASPTPGGAPFAGADRLVTMSR
ncbi:hypothetical protein ACVNF4_33940, partial [Streptomyces sp. S6]